MHLDTFTLIDDEFIRAEVSIPGSPRLLVVEAQQFAPGLVHIDHAHWAGKRASALDVAANHHAEILALLIEAAAEAAEEA